MSTSGASFLLELSSATATKTGAPREARYQLQLNPGINIPYLAEPKAQLETLTFANVFTNIDRDFYHNAKLKVTWNPYVYTVSSPITDTAPVRHQKELEVTLPEGHYDVPSLVHKIGELLYANQTITAYPAKSQKLDNTDVSRKAATYITSTSTLFSDMQVLATLPSKDLGRTVTIPEHADDPSGTSNRYLDVADEPDTLTAYVGGWIRLNHVGPVFSRIIGVEAILSNLNQEGLGGLALGKSRLHLSTDVTGIISGIGSEAKTFHILQPSLKFKPDGHDTTAAPSETMDADFFGYEALGACRPNFADASPWYLAMTVDQMRGIASADQAADAPPHEALMGTAERTQYVLPIAMQPDVRTGLLETATGAPILRIDPSSTLFTNAIGYTAADMAEQNPFTHIVTSSPEDVSGEPATNRAMDASKGGRLLRTTSVAFHCPSLVSSSYNQYGELAGAVMAPVPITVPSNNVQPWQAMYDTSIPCNLHGGTVDTIDFYLTNQDGDNIDMMGNDWLATVRLSWDQPTAPPLGSFGAEAESAYGLLDVIYATQQQNQR